MPNYSRIIATGEFNGTTLGEFILKRIRRDILEADLPDDVCKQATPEDVLCAVSDVAQAQDIIRVLVSHIEDIRNGMEDEIRELAMS